MRILKSWVEKTKEEIEKVVTRNYLKDPELEGMVRKIISEVRRDGDQAVLRYTKEFDHVALTTSKVKVRKKEIREASKYIDKKILESLKLAKARIESFHRQQLASSWMSFAEEGIALGQLSRPLERVGVYVPGGVAPLVSTVLMTVIPAKVAGVKEVIICSPPQRDGKLNPYILKAADLAGATAIYKIGGAQAIAALAYGTKTVPKVDKIVGPGNIYVALAKKLVYGDVGIDMIAGPSEIVVIADRKANSRFIASDLLSQAEHGEMSRAILLVTSETKAVEVKIELGRQLVHLKWKEVIMESFYRDGAIIAVRNLKEAVDLANRIAPEHLELMVENPWEMLGLIKNAGAIFIGPYTPESLGDYLAGPSHVLPTGGTARFYSPLSVDDFIKRSSLIFYSQKNFEEVKRAVIDLASIEGLDAHANSIKVREEGRERRIK